MKEYSKEFSCCEYFFINGRMDTLWFMNVTVEKNPEQSGTIRAGKKIKQVHMIEKMLCLFFQICLHKIVINTSTVEI